MGELAFASISLERLTCWVCGLDFAVPQTWAINRRANGKGFVCPNGCSIRFGEGEAARLKKELEAANRRLEMEKNMRMSAERQATAQRGQITKAKNETKRLKLRAANGVCPCCHRTVSQLARHMQSKHPDFMKKEED